MIPAGVFQVICTWVDAVMLDWSNVQPETENGPPELTVAASYAPIGGCARPPRANSWSCAWLPLKMSWSPAKTPELAYCHMVQSSQPAASAPGVLVP